MIINNIKTFLLNKNIIKSYFSIFLNNQPNNIDNKNDNKNDNKINNKDNVIIDERLFNEIIYKDNKDNNDDYYNKPLYD
jgi:hypothetical protein